MKRVLITGVNGFIGRHIAEMLKKEKKYQIYGIGKKISKSSVENINYIERDICSDGFVDSMYNKLPLCEIIIHLAACIDFNKEKECLKVNVLGTYQVCRLANRWNCSQFIYFSSIPVIGRPEIFPITEKHMVNPKTVYHISKCTGEQIVKGILNPQIKSLILRVPSPVGKGMRTSTIIGVFLENCMKNNALVLKGKGRRRQNYVDVRDICNAVLKSIEKQADGLYHIAGEHSFSNLELARICIDIVKSESEIVFQGEDLEEEFNWDISIEKARNEIGYIPQFSIQESLSWIFEDMRRE